MTRWTAKQASRYSNGLADPEKAAKRANALAYPAKRLESRFKRTSKALKAPVPTEHEEQVRVIQWWAHYAATHKIPECLLFAIPNGANKSMASAAKFKREGLRAGIPDLFLAVPRPPYHGLFVEMKRVKRSTTSDWQKSAIINLSVRGYDVYLAYGADEAIDAITRYLA